MESTRLQIIEYLREKELASAIEISNALSLTAADIRHHLSVLKKEGVVRTTGQRPPSGRGRPVHLFSLTERVQRNNLGVLASALLEEFINTQPPTERGAALEKLANRLANTPIDQVSNLPKRLFRAVAYLNELNYQARWEAHAIAPQVILGHCPYAAILPDHPELCLLDAKLIERLIDTPIKQIDKLNRDASGMIFCTFMVEEPPHPTHPPIS
jgi:predicted ArsR family transcriptional regulator